MTKIVYVGLDVHTETIAVAVCEGRNVARTVATWLAVHRWRDKDPIAQAWYQRKVQRDGGRKARAAVALMRKLAMALFHVARGANLDSAKLFDIRKLKLPA